MSAVKAWAGDTGIRAVKTAAQTLVALFGAGQFNVLHADWRADLGVALGAGVVSILQNVSSFPSATPGAVDPIPATPSTQVAQVPDVAPVDPVEPPAA